MESISMALPSATPAAAAGSADSSHRSGDDSTGELVLAVLTLPRFPALVVAATAAAAAAAAAAASPVLLAREFLGETLPV
jgi:hypothetical protein